MPNEIDPKSLLQKIHLSTIDCEYCDVRIEKTFETVITIKNHELTACLEQDSLGAFLRVRKNGIWYFAATTDLESIEEQLRNLSQITIPVTGKSWHSVPANNGSFEAIHFDDKKVSAVPLSQKVDLLNNYNELIKGRSKVKTSQSRYKDTYKVKTFKNSSGTFFHYDFNKCGFVHYLDFADGKDVFSDHKGFYGSDFTQLSDRKKEVAQFMSEGEAFLSAPYVTPGKYKVVLSPEVTGVFVHESFGHNSEADFMLGDPRAIENWQLGKKVAADFVNLVDSGLHPGTSGYCPIDDEGQMATKTALIKNGLLVGRLHSYETALALDEKPTGNGRALSFEYEPIVRMTSTYIENGKTSLPDLFRQAEGGIYIENYQYGTGMTTFAIAPGKAYFIKDGQPKFPVRANVISGSVFETLLNIEALGDNYDLKSSALGGCGKMGQMPLPVADGGPTMLIKDMQVS